MDEIMKSIINDIKTNRENIEKNVLAIEKNALAIEKNALAIEKITPAIEKNTLAIERNTLAISKLQTYSTNFGADHTHEKPELTFSPASKYFVCPSDRYLTQLTYTKTSASACHMLLKAGGPDGSTTILDQLLPVQGHYGIINVSSRPLVTEGAMVSVHLETIHDHLGESTIQLKWELA